jgi:hypothetical protein
VDEREFIRAMERRFRAKLVSADRGIDPKAESAAPPSSSSPPPPSKCALCRRPDKLGDTIDDFGRRYCREAEWAQCNRIAAGRLGASASASTSSASLSGELHADGKCRDCGEPIAWVTTQRGRKMPVDVRPARPNVAAFELVGRVDTLAFYVSEQKRARMSGDVYECHRNTCSAGDD